jgi:hypothetical protein
MPRVQALSFDDGNYPAAAGGAKSELRTWRNTWPYVGAQSVAVFTGAVRSHRPMAAWPRFHSGRNTPSASTSTMAPMMASRMGSMAADRPLMA